MEDQSLLPQTQAFILETYRWRPVSVGGVAHRATKDIIWVSLHQYLGSVVSIVLSFIQPSEITVFQLAQLLLAITGESDIIIHYLRITVNQTTRSQGNRP